MIPADNWRAANEMIRMFGDDAQVRAAMRADSLLDEGDAEGFSVWKQITRAIVRLQGGAGGRDEQIH